MFVLGVRLGAMVGGKLGIEWRINRIDHIEEDSFKLLESLKTLSIKSNSLKLISNYFRCKQL